MAWSRGKMIKRPKKDKKWRAAEFNPSVEPIGSIPGYPVRGDRDSAALILYDAGGILCPQVAIIKVGLLAAPSAQIPVVAARACSFEIGLDPSQR